MGVAVWLRLTARDSEQPDAQAERLDDEVGRQDKKPYDEVAGAQHAVQTAKECPQTAAREVTKNDLPDSEDQQRQQEKPEQQAREAK